MQEYEHEKLEFLQSLDRVRVRLVNAQEIGSEKKRGYLQLLESVESLCKSSAKEPARKAFEFLIQHKILQETFYNLELLENHEVTSLKNIQVKQVNGKFEQEIAI